MNTPDPKLAAPDNGVGCGDLFGRDLSKFQALVWGDMRAGVWYGDIVEDGIEDWPMLLCRRGIQHNVTLACLLEKGYVEKRMHTYTNGTKWRVFRRVSPNT